MVEAGLPIRDGGGENLIILVAVVVVVLKNKKLVKTQNLKILIEI